MAEPASVIIVVLGKHRGGGEEYLLRLFRSASPALRSQITALFVYALCYQHYRPVFEKMGIRCLFAEGGRWAQLQRLAGLIRGVRPRVVHFNGGCDRAAPFFLLKPFFPRVRFCMTNHLTPDPDLDQKRYRLLRKVNRSFRTLPLFLWADPLIFVSQHQVGLMARNRYFRPRRPQVVYNGVSLRERGSEGSDSGGLVVGLVGNAEPRKKLGFALECLALVSPDVPDFKVSHFGAGGDVLERDLPQPLIGRFAAHGFVADKDSVYGSLSLLFSPGYHEACPYNVIEAMSYGVPVLVPDTALYRELYGIDGGSAALLFRKDDAAGASARLRQLLTDGELRARLGVLGRDLVERRFEVNRTNSQTWQAVLGPHFAPELLQSI